MTKIFVADIHLNEADSALTDKFIGFLQSIASQADELYILGDLFAFWVGDDDPNPLHKQIAEQLKYLASLGVKSYFIHGNRDFLLQQSFAQLSGLTVLPAENIITSDQKRILILHGDQLCIDDHHYQRMRRVFLNPTIQLLFLRLPLKWRLCIADRIRKKSQRSNQYKEESLMDVNTKAVISTFQQYRVEIMIHGHTHRPAVHTYTVNGKRAKRMVLGAWHTEGSYIQADGDHIVLKSFSLFSSNHLSD